MSEDTQDKSAMELIMKLSRTIAELEDIRDDLLMAYWRTAQPDEEDFMENVRKWLKDADKLIEYKGGKI